MTIKYRLWALPSRHVFPLPVHDTLKAFDYIGSPNSPHNAGQHPRLSLYGSYIGGLLATSLALTEPTSIHAVAVSEPVVDWVSLDDEKYEENKSPKPTTKRKSKPSSSKTFAPPDPARLLSIRSKLFRSPASYFDAFASPLLFLRAPGRDCLSENPDPLLTPSQNTPRASPQAFGSYDDDLDTRPGQEDYTYIPMKRRKVLRRWPPNTTAPIIPPHTRVYVRDTPSGEAGVLSTQGAELVELMRRACFYGREKGFAESRVTLEKLGTGSSDDVDSALEGSVGVEQAGEWLAQKFEEERD